jgi:REP element-mobilizing transposase RayT
MKEEFAWRTGRSCVFKNFIHLVFVTKYRRGVFNQQMLERLKNLLCDLSNKKNTPPILLQKVKKT